MNTENMNTHLKSFLVGAGSILSISPARSYEEFVPHESPDQRMRQSWQMTGDQIKGAMAEYNDESKKEL